MEEVRLEGCIDVVNVHTGADEHIPGHKRLHIDELRQRRFARLARIPVIHRAATDASGGEHLLNEKLAPHVAQAKAVLALDFRIVTKNEDGAVKVVGEQVVRAIVAHRIDEHAEAVDRLRSGDPTFCHVHLQRLRQVMRGLDQCA